MSITGDTCMPTTTEYNESDGLVYVYCEMCGPEPIQAFEPDPVHMHIIRLRETTHCHNVTFSPPPDVKLGTDLDADVWGAL